MFPLFFDLRESASCSGIDSVWVQGRGLGLPILFAFFWDTTTVGIKSFLRAWQLSSVENSHKDGPEKPPTEKKFMGSKNWTYPGRKFTELLTKANVNYQYWKSDSVALDCCAIFSIPKKRSPVFGRKNPCIFFWDHLCLAGKTLQHFKKFWTLQKRKSVIFELAPGPRKAIWVNYSFFFFCRGKRKKVKNPWSTS